MEYCSWSQRSRLVCWCSAPCRTTCACIQHVYLTHCSCVQFFAAMNPYGSFLFWGGRAARFGRLGGALVQSRELSWMGRRFGELRLGNVRRPSARGSTRGPGSPRIAPGRNRCPPAGGAVSTQKASTLTLNAVATRGTDAAAPLRREQKLHGPYRGGTGGAGHCALHIQPRPTKHQASSQQSSLIKDKPT